MRASSIDVFQYKLTYTSVDHVMSQGRSQMQEQPRVVEVGADNRLIGWDEISPCGGTYLPEFFTVPAKGARIFQVKSDEDRSGNLFLGYLDFSQREGTDYDSFPAQL